MSKMKWITKEQVRAYATSPARALDISIEHHQQIVDATEEELAAQACALAGYLCGVCVYYRKGDTGMSFPGQDDKCGACPLADGTITCYKRGSLYQNALELYNATPFDHKAFIKAETALLNRLKQLKSGDKSMNRKQEIQISIKQNEKDQQRLRDEAKDLERELAETEVTYSIGDRFEARGIKMMLCNPDYNNVAMITLSTGGGHFEPVRVKILRAITEQELVQICNCSAVRYWDARKGKKV